MRITSNLGENSNLNKKYLYSTYKIVLGVALMALSSWITIPMKPVPITFHTLVISLVGLLYSPKESFLTVAVYLCAGIAGAPMFSGFGAGFEAFLGPAFGYRIGFLLAAPIIGILKNKISDKFWNIFVPCFIGHVIIYFLGVSWLASLIGFSEAFYSGFLIFAPSGVAKIIIFSYVFCFIRSKL